MRYSILFTGALATAASASPALFKRYYVTEYAYVTDVVTVTAGSSTATPTPSEVSVAAVPSSSGGWSNWFGNFGGSSSSQAPAPVVTTTTPPPAPTTTWAPPPAPTTTKQATHSQAPAPSKPSTGGGAPAYSDIVVMHHNLHRRNHSAPDLSWSAELEASAYALASQCNYTHNVTINGGGYGQNIAAGAPADNISSIITDHMYNGEIGFFEPFFGEATPSDMSPPTFDTFGHFTQIVWKGTTQVGCATYDCSGRGIIGLGDDVPPYSVVCNYGPPGNYLGEFADNVARPNGQPQENWSWGI